MADLGNIFRKTFDNYTIDPSDKVWQNIESKINTLKPSGRKFLNKGTTYIAASILVVAATAFLIVQQLNTKKGNLVTKNQVSSPIFTSKTPSNSTQTQITSNNVNLGSTIPVNKFPSQNTENYPIVTNLGNSEKTEIQTFITKETGSNLPTAINIDNKATFTETNPTILSSENLNFAKTTPVFTISKNDTLCKGESITLKAQGGQTYLWNTGDITDSITVTPFNTLKYSVTASSFGFDTTLIVTITVRSCNSLYVPTAFTPDNDGKNDYFHPVKQDNIGIEKYEMKILSRTGKLVYATKSFEDLGWDGKFEGNDAPESFYLWYLKYTDSENFSHELRGQVYLYRH